jgi:hypothetical protein
LEIDKKREVSTNKEEQIDWWHFTSDAGKEVPFSPKSNTTIENHFQRQIHLKSQNMHAPSEIMIISPECTSRISFNLSTCEGVQTDPKANIWRPI